MKLPLLFLLAFAASLAKAAIVTVTLPAPVRIEDRSSSGALQPFDLDQDGQKDVEFVSGPFLSGLVTIGNNRIPSFLYEGVFGGEVLPVFAGDLIGLNSGFVLGGAWHNSRENSGGFEGGFLVGECAAMSGCGGTMIFVDGYIGVEFERATGTHYGWIRWRGGGGPWGRVYGWGWETEPGVPIIAGAVPEPGSWVLLSASAGALALRRRRGNPAKGNEI
jgi:hypothetical protein